MTAVSPLSSWFADDRTLTRFRRQWLGRAPIIVPARDRAWRAIAPGFHAVQVLAASGLPFQIAADRQYDRSADRRRLSRALEAGKTVFLPQVHQVLPRVMRLMVALRVAFLGPFREECSFLFAVRGQARPAMGLHHDGNVDAFWLQLEGRRTVTVGPAVPPGTPEDLDEHLADRGHRAGWWTRDLEPGTLFYLPPYTPHRVVCRGRSLALSLTWGSSGQPRRAAAVPSLRRARADAARLTAWDVVSGYVNTLPPASRTRLWTQVPAVAGPVGRARRELPVWTPNGGELWLPAAMEPLARRLAMMPSFRREEVLASPEGWSRLIEHGIVAARDLPLWIIPQDPAGLDGWRFA